MRVASVIRQFAFAGLFVLGTREAFAQSEIDPDHFDSSNTEPIQQPKAPASTRIDTIR